MKPPNIRRDFSNFQSYAFDQRPYWQLILATPGKLLSYFKDLVFPVRPPSDVEIWRGLAEEQKRYLAERNAKVEELLKTLNLPSSEIPSRRRWERLIEVSKKEINEWDWDAQFGNLEDSGDREALYLGIFEETTKEPRLRRERFHREALERVKRVDKNLPSVERREFLAKEVAIAAAHGHIGDEDYQDIAGGVDGESLIARDKLFKSLVVDFFIPHLEKFRGVIAARDDNSIVEQMRVYWQPKQQLLEKIDRLLSVCKLERQFRDEEKAEWIYELYMAPKFYTEMERKPGEALEYVYWTQGKECVPEGYESPDEVIFRLMDTGGEDVQKQLRKELGNAYEIMDENTEIDEYAERLAKIRL